MLSVVVVKQTDSKNTTQTESVLNKKRLRKYQAMSWNEYCEFTTSVTHKAYKNVPLADVSPKSRGTIIENVVRKVLTEMTDEKTHDPDAGTTISGNKRGKTSASHDFYLGKRKIEVKSAQLSWNKSKKCYYAKFKNIKRKEYDDLYLGLYTPSGLYIFKHDHNFGTSTTGKQQESRGGYITVCGPCNEESIDVATNVILEKMKSMHVKTIKY